MLHFKKIYRILSLCSLLILPGQIRAQRFLIPETAMIQRAGSIGYNSFGLGYNLFRKNTGSLDLAWGYVPKSKGGRQDIFAAKFAYRPFKIRIKELIVINPINPGLFVSHHPGGKFHTTFNKNQYPDGYYWWSSAVRIHASLSTEIKINTPKSLSSTGIEQFALYTELNTNELYAVSWFKNKDYLPFKDILKLGIGVKAYF